MYLQSWDKILQRADYDLYLQMIIFNNLIFKFKIFQFINSNETVRKIHMFYNASSIINVCTNHDDAICESYFIISSSILGWE